jgi:hypothetical protein
MQNVYITLPPLKHCLKNIIRLDKYLPSYAEVERRNVRRFSWKVPVISFRFWQKENEILQQMSVNFSSTKFCDSSFSDSRVVICIQTDIKSDIITCSQECERAYK